MENWTSWNNKEYPDCEHCFNELVNDCITALDKMVLERYPDKNDGPHSGFYHQEQPDGVPIMPCGGVVKCSFRMWGELMAKIASKRDREYYTYMDFAWVAGGDHQKGDDKNIEYKTVYPERYTWLF